jgi:NNP family nitrate/nitrite transporter-like MFS transporter
VLAVAAFAYWLLVHDAPRQGGRLELRALLAPLERAQTWRFGLYYMATFGVFVAATLTITDIYVDGYLMPLKTAGLLATTFTCAASLCRIPGGRFSDRFGARRTLRLSLIAMICGLTPVCFGLPLAVTVGLVFLSGVAMGCGMAAVFRYIPDYFPDTVGAVGGAVGALGGLGGFFLPQLGEVMKTSFGTPYVEVVPMASLALMALFVQQWAVRDLRAQTQSPGAGDLAALRSAVSQPGVFGAAEAEPKSADTGVKF